MIEFFKNIIFDFGDTAIIVTGITLILRRIIDNFFEKKNIKFKITYEKLQIERAEVIKETYKKMVLANDLLESYIKPYRRVKDKSEDEKLKEANESFNDFYEFYDKNRIFF